MPAIFISHSSSDPELAFRVKSWIEKLGYEQTFLDFDKTDGLGAGEGWEQRLYQEIARCHAVILILTPAWIASKWCFAEFTSARSQGKIIIPLVCAPGGDIVIAPELQNLDLRGWDSEGLSHLEGRLRAITDDLARGFKWTAGRPPYTGLESFETEDAAVFFGRDGETRDVIAWMDARRIQGGAPSLLMIHGTSGSGKSSLLKAGVLPQLQRDVRRWIALPAVRPGAAPLAALSKVLAMAEGKPRDGARWLALLSGSDGVVHIQALFEGHRYGDARQAVGVLCFDQFEELYTVAPPEERVLFLKLLAAICTSGEHPAAGLPILCLATARSDLIFPAFALNGFDLPYAERLLPPMPLERVAKLVAEPAKIGALSLEAGLAERVSRDMRDATQLPLLAFTLRDLYDRFAHDRRLTITEYLSLGDPVQGLDPIANAVRRRSSETIDHLRARADELTGLREAFVPHLVRLRAEEGLWIRHPACRADLPMASLRLVDGFVAARLLTARLIDGEPAVEVAHEALFSAWPMLASWLAAERTFLADLERLYSSYRIWADVPAVDKPGALLRGMMLARGSTWKRDHPDRFARGDLEPVGGFIAASEERAAEEAREVARRERRLRLMRALATAAGVVALAVTGGAALMLERGNLALRAEVAIAASQDALREGRIEVAIETAREAFDTSPSPESRTAFLAALLHLSPLAESARSLRGEIGTALAWSNSTTLDISLASGGILETTTGTLRKGLSALRDGSAEIGAIAALLITPQGVPLCVKSDGEIVTFRAHERPQRLFKPASSITIVPGNGVSMGRTGQSIALASPDGGVLILLRTADGSYQATTLSKERVRSLDLSPDESELAIGGENGRVRIIHLQGSTGGEELSSIGSEDDAVTALRWSTDGKLLAIGTASGAVVVFNPKTQAQVQRLAAARRPVAILAWSFHSTTLAFGCGEGPVCLWRFEAADPSLHRLQRLAGHLAPLRAIAWSPAADRLATLDVESILRTWSLAEDQSVQSSVYAPPSTELTTVAAVGYPGIFAGAADGRLFGWTSLEAMPTIVDANTGGRISSLAAATDGMLAAGHDDGSLTFRSSKPGDRPSESFKVGSVAIQKVVWRPGKHVLAFLDHAGRIATLDQVSAPGVPTTCLGLQTKGDAIAWSSEFGGLFVSSLNGIALNECIGAKPSQVLSSLGRQRVDALSLSVSSDGKWLASSGGANRFAVLYDLADPNARSYEMPTSVEAVAVAFSPDGHRLAVLASGGRVTIWSVMSGSPRLLVSFSVSLEDREDGGRVFGETMTWAGDNRLAFTGSSDEVHTISLDEGLWRARAKSIDETLSALAQ